MHAPGAAQGVVKQLRRLARYQTVLEMVSPSSELTSQFRVQLLLAPDGWKDGDKVTNVGGTALQLTDGVYEVKNNAWLWLRLTNATPGQPVNAALLALNDVLKLFLTTRADCPRCSICGSSRGTASRSC